MEIAQAAEAPKNMGFAPVHFASQQLELEGNWRSRRHRICPQSIDLSTESRGILRGHFSLGWRLVPLVYSTYMSTN
ncbi:hypothetical protein I7I50_05133 [Histoplasma capsulatum G186AR]|uniref:Uncharacterized protein n=1 Tax=Ajellomyces capsulatus TaxID=5037 RepID=A0A8H7Z6I2_AJECA|nr:hypothetical protein I7I52_03391 [Histoplasma capsulatum]QSS75856.1 hypothetical protein I7I50_05133 [Histoplasma capsulatum G186AR]